jgi:DNA-directed RNA polymerase subunit RPC12/RpoP
MATEPTYQILLAQLRAASQAQPRLRSQRPKCPRCGDKVLVAERSRFDLAGRIEHIWSCDDCGKQFLTSISLVPAMPV